MFILLKEICWTRCDSFQLLLTSKRISNPKDGPEGQNTTRKQKHKKLSENKTFERTEWQKFWNVFHKMFFYLGGGMFSVWLMCCCLILLWFENFFAFLGNVVFFYVSFIFAPSFFPEMLCSWFNVVVLSNGVAFCTLIKKDWLNWLILQLFSRNATTNRTFETGNEIDVSMCLRYNHCKVRVT